MKKVITLLLSIGALIHCQAKAQKTLDSLKQALSVVRTDSGKVKLLLAIGDALQNENSDLVGSKHYYRLGGQLSRKAGYSVGTLEYLFDYSDALVQQGLYDSSLVMNQEASSLAKRISDSSRLYRALFNIGVSYSGMENYPQAIRYFLLAAGYYERKAQMDKVGMCANELMILFRQTKNYVKAIQYGEQAIKLYRAYRPPDKLSIPLQNLAVVYQSMQAPEKAAPLLKEALFIDKKYHQAYGELNDLINLVDLETHLNYMAATKAYCDRILILGRQMEDKESVADGLLGLAQYYLYRDQLAQAALYADSALKVAQATSINELKQSCYMVLSRIAYSSHQYEKAMAYDQQVNLSEQAVTTANINRSVLELQTKYETEKKEASIKNLQNQQRLQQVSIQKKRIYNIVMIIIIVALLLIGFLYARNFERKQKLLLAEKMLQRQQISSLEQEKQLLATKAVLQGQEEERSRLAKDLHDGLGGILSGAKFSLNNLKDNMIIPAEHAAAFERTVDILDKSIFELRRVAHNMMPESLVSQPLKDALRDYCALITASGVLHIDYHDVGMEHMQLESPIKLTIYRIIQELIGNIIKHAAASKAIVQLIADEHVLRITVEDNGKGFDPKILATAGGIGYKNIYNRIDYLKGKIDIDSHKGNIVSDGNANGNNAKTDPNEQNIQNYSKGTSVYLEIKI